ncbi:MAG: alpha/beta fold hydrolase [Planctomycetota bacterium]
MSPIAKDVLPYESHSMSVGDHQLRYLDEGPNDATETILCVHGNPTWSYYFRSVVDRFKDRYRVVAVDHLGCGRSDKPPEDQFGYRLSDHRDNLIKLIQQLDLTRVNLLAHDWGGAIGLAAMVRCQERVSRIALLNTGAFPPPYLPLRIAACRWPVVGPLGVRGLNLFARAAVPMAMSRNRLTAEAAAGLLAPYDSWRNRVAINAFVRDIPMNRAHPTHAALESLESQLSALRSRPIVLVWGMKDWCFRPECLQRFESHWPEATAVRIPDAGHYVLLDAPEETLQAIEEHLSRSSDDADTDG